MVSSWSDCVVQFRKVSHRRKHSSIAIPAAWYTRRRRFPSYVLDRDVFLRQMNDAIAREIALQRRTFVVCAMVLVFLSAAQVFEETVLTSAKLSLSLIVCRFCVSKSYFPCQNWVVERLKRGLNEEGMKMEVCVRLMQLALYSLFSFRMFEGWW